MPFLSTWERSLGACCQDLNPIWVIVRCKQNWPPAGRGAHQTALQLQYCLLGNYVVLSCR